MFEQSLIESRLYLRVFIAPTTIGVAIKMLPKLALTQGNFGGSVAVAAVLTLELVEADSYNLLCRTQLRTEIKQKAITIPYTTNRSIGGWALK